MKKYLSFMLLFFCLTAAGQEYRQVVPSLQNWDSHWKYWLFDESSVNTCTNSTFYFESFYNPNEVNSSLFVAFNEFVLYDEATFAARSGGTILDVRDLDDTYQSEHAIQDVFTSYNWSGFTSPKVFYIVIYYQTYHKNSNTYSIIAPWLNIMAIKRTFYPKPAVGSIKIVPNQSVSKQIEYNTSPGQFAGIAATGGDGTFTYQWQSKGSGGSYTDIYGANSTDYYPSNLLTTTSFRRKDTPNKCGSALYTNELNITVLPNVSAGQTGTSQTVCYGSNVTLQNIQSASGGTGTYSYQWQSSADGSYFQDIAGATGVAYSANNLTATTYYKRKCTSGVNTAESNIVAITVRSDLTSGRISQSQTLCYGTIPSQLVGTNATGGDGNYSYQWQYSNDGNAWSDISSATGVNYQPIALTVTTYYHRVVTSGSGCGSKTSSPVTMSVYGNLTSGTIYTSQTICYGGTPSQLSGTSPAGGDGNYAYQWQSSADGNTWSDIPLATGATYGPGALTATTYYHRMVTSGSGCGSKTSAPVTITVYDDINPGTISPSQTICYGTTPSQLSGTNESGGDGNYAYQWQSSADGNTWSDIPLATGTNYQPGALTGTTYYHRVVTSGSGCGSKTGAPVTIAVRGDLTPGSISQSQTLCYGAAPFLIVGTSATGGDGNYSYKWQSSTDGNTWSDISAGLNYQPGVLTVTTYYQRIVTSGSGCGSKTSSPVTMTVHDNLTSGIISSSQTICNGTSPSQLSGTSPSGGDNNYSYLWQSSADGNTWSDIPLASGTNYQPGNLTFTTYYHRVVTSGSGCGSKTSAPVTITVLGSLDPGSISKTQTICYGSTPLKINGTDASGANGVFNYQWKYSSDGSNYLDMPGETNLSYGPGALTQTTWYKRVVTTNCGTGESPVVTVIVHPDLNAGTISSSQTICYNAMPSLITGTIPTGGDGDYSYQWQSSADGNTWSDITLATGSNYEPGALTVTTSYRRIVTSGSGCGNKTSTPVTITVYGKLDPGKIFGSEVICYSASADGFTGTTASGGDGSYTYQWKSSKDDSTWYDIPGASNLTYEPGALTQTTWYKRMESNSCGSGLSDSVKIEVKNEVDPGSVSNNQSICFNSIPQGLTGNDATGGFGNLSYQWQISTDNMTYTDIATATDKDYQPGNMTSSSYFRRKVTDAKCGSFFTSPILINVMTKLTVPAVLYSSVYCRGTDVSLAAGSDFTYYWYDANHDLIKTGSAYSVKNIQNDQSLYVKAQDNRGCSSDVRQISLIVDKVKADFTINSTSIAVGEPIEFTNESENASSYLWDFSEGEPSTVKNPWHVFNLAGKKNVKLISYSANECSDTVINAINIGVLGIKDITNDDGVLAYPNPVSTALNVELEGINTNTMVSLYNMQGVLIYQSKCLGHLKIDFSGFAPGIYLLQMNSDNAKRIIKIIKQ